MRHFLLPIAFLSGGVVPAANARPLVAGPGAPQALAPRLLGAAPRAVGVATVTAPADQHRSTTPRADVCPTAFAATARTPMDHRATAPGSLQGPRDRRCSPRGRIATSDHRDGPGGPGSTPGPPPLPGDDLLSHEAGDRGKDATLSTARRHAPVRDLSILLRPAASPAAASWLNSGEQPPGKSGERRRRWRQLSPARAYW